MQIEHALLADFAEIVGGKLYLMGGGWDRSTVPQLPAQLRLAVAVGIRIGWEETNRPVPVQILVEDDDGHQLLRMDGQVNMGRPPHLPPGSSQLTQIAANFALTVQAAGGYHVRIEAGAGESVDERRLPFRVSVGQSGVTPPSA